MAKKNVAKKKPKHGGARIGSGRKPFNGKAAKVTLSLRVDKEVKDYLMQSGNASREVERLVKHLIYRRD